MARGLDAASAEQLLSGLSMGSTRTEYEKKSNWARWVSRCFYYLTFVALLVGMISVFLRVAAC